MASVGSGSTSSDTAILCPQNGNSSPGEPPPPPSYCSIPGVVPLYQGRQPGPPPSYDDVINPDAPPPTYQSLFGQVKEARRTSSGFLDFIRKVIIIVFGTLGCTVIIATTVVIPVTMIVIGSMYLNDCRVQQYIPIYLIVGGAFGVAKNLRSCCGQCTKTDDSEQNTSKQRPDESLLNCFLFAWFIAGCVWIYGAYEPDYVDTSSPRYCHKTVYLFAFWLVTSAYIVMGLLTCGLCCITVSALLLSNPD